jgi:DNA replication and repair protein RecF
LGTPLPACAVQRLRLNNFRNYGSLALDLSAQVVVLSGANGAGKTNLLEALSFLSPGRGLRRARLRDVLRQDAPPADELARDSANGWAVAATVQGPGGAINLGSSLATTESGTDRRVARQDGQAMAPAGLAKVIGVQWLTPQMDRLFLEGPSSRRRFLDRLVLGLDPEHGRRVGAYERSLRERAKLLAGGVGDPTWLAALEARMAADGVAVAAARREAVAQLQQQLSGASGYFPRAGLAIEGRLEGWLEDYPAVEVESRFGELLQSNRRRDAQNGSTGDGPHRSDLSVRHLGKDTPAAQCSTGEQKALLIAVMLANAKAEAGRRGAAPILLLDEVAAHLDGERRAALFAEILALGGQAWLSGTDRDLFEPLSGQAQFVAVDRGRVMVDG